MASQINNKTSIPRQSEFLTQSSPNTHRRFPTQKSPVNLGNFFY